MKLYLSASFGPLFTAAITYNEVAELLSGVCTTSPRISPMNRPLGHHPDGLSPLLTSARYDAGGDYSFLVAWPDRASSDSEPATHTPKWETGQPRPAPPADGNNYARVFLPQWQRPAQARSLPLSTASARLRSEAAGQLDAIRQLYRHGGSVRP